ncbi:helix-turn-helix domain-containing protein [Brevibacillus sp. SYP-B805]|uniref:helix-turn-helix transcriptional regulator n=1 Tax=Brevibacillus sp. SYP-B805 TaxID=1578199 RepID=UPI0013EC8457|nr:helix-turn-helix domain-containing protein [Brevibacillus sp. SYP-B805]NGQ93691.1 helix-turn-helix domain-containing protein [Brevibacillus sp. SYP-B805]
MGSDAQKLTSALADPTRFSIYQFVAASKDALTVQEIADHFAIHPNVARLHLGKLEDVDLIKSFPDKSGKGGRPCRLYALSDQVVSLQFPPRDYQLLAEIAIESLLSLGEVGEQALIKMGYRIGREMAKRAMEQHPIDPAAAPLEETLAHINRLVIAQGLKPDIECVDAGTIRFRVYNCTFSETARRFANSVCKLHNSMLTGIFEAYFGEIELKEENSMLTGCKACSYTLVRLQKQTV